MKNTLLLRIVFGGSCNAVILKWSGNLLELNIAPRKLNIPVKALFKESGHVIGNQRDGFVHARLVLKQFIDIRKTFGSIGFLGGRLVPELLHGRSR